MTQSPTLAFAPLGGTGEIGMNLNLYGYDGTWIVVDCGIGFEQDRRGRTQVVRADARAILDREHPIAAIIVTHVHLDHIGAVDRLALRTGAPVHLSPFAAQVLRQRLRFEPRGDRVKIVEHTIGERFKVGAFDLQTVGLTHSTLEATGLIVRTPAANVFHTGDYKLDSAPVLGPRSDLAALRALRDEGPLTVVGDSTNATREGRTPTEASVVEHLDGLIGAAEGRVAVATFASHIARIASLATIARKHRRTPILIGRSLLNMTDAARLAGWLRDLEPFGSAEDATRLPPERVLLIATGTQGEPGSGMHRLAHGTHRSAHLFAGDTAIFSSKIIPGNEVPIATLHRALRGRHIEVISEIEDPGVHASGHPYRGDIRALYDVLQPTGVLPVHGEARHLAAHAQLAREIGIPHVLEIRDGDLLSLSANGPRRVGQLPIGREVHRSA